MHVKLELDRVRRVFSSSTNRSIPVLDEVSLTVGEGEFVSILGPSGCGKSTLFSIVAGIDRPSAGAIKLDGKVVTGEAGHVGYMLQKDLLMPWRTALDNAVVALELRGASRAAARERAREYFAQYGLSGFESALPRQLSGGMRQRVALLRTVLYDSDVILLDEPFGALDAQTRMHMQDWLLSLWSDLGKTVLFVTHDVDEALYLSDRVFVLTRRPASVLEVIDVARPRPRERADLLDSDFAQARHRCFTLLGSGVVAADEQAAGVSLPMSV